MPASRATSRTFLWGALLVLATCAAYAPVRDNGFVWDDDAYVLSNPNLGEVSGLRRIWLDFNATPQYYPMVHTTFWVEHALWGFAPAGYHVVNVLLHALCSLLFWRVLLRLGLPGAWFAAGIFALHPVHVESVAWITERKNVLSGVFYFASLLAYLRSLPLPGGPGDDPGRARLYALSLLAFAAALLSKTVTGSLPAVILLLVWWRNGRLTAADVWPLVPFFALALVFGFLTVQLESQQVGATGSEWELSWLERCLVAGRALWFYAGKLAWPTQLSFNYPRWHVDAGDPAAWAWPLGVLALLAALFALRGRLSRGPLVSVLIFCGTLVPALSFFDVYPMRYSFVADHFQYLASAGLIALFAAALASATAAGPLSRAAPAGAALVLACLAALTWQQSRVYRDLETLWRETLAVNPASWLALDSLGVIHERRGEQDEAIAYYKRSIRAAPDQPAARNNLGNALRARGQYRAAIAQLQRALELDPRYVLAHNNLGLTLHAMGRYRQAEEQFREALRIHPSFAVVHTNLGVTLEAEGRPEEALREHRRAIELDPTIAQAHANLAALLLRRGEREAAIVHLERVVALEPDSREARRNLAAARRAPGAGSGSDAP